MDNIFQLKYYLYYLFERETGEGFDEIKQSIQLFNDILKDKEDNLKLIQH